MSIGLIGKKIGMTREFFDSGISVPVTVLFVEKGRIIDVITKEKRGYDAVQVGFGRIKNSKLTKQMKGVFAKKNTEAKKILREFRVKNISEFKEGNEIGIELFKDQKVILLGMPGAFTKTCSAVHLPSFIDSYNVAIKKGITKIICVSVNDANVMKAWGINQKVDDKILMIGDPFCKFTSVDFGTE